MKYQQDTPSHSSNIAHSRRANPKRYEMAAGQRKSCSHRWQMLERGPRELKDEDSASWQRLRCAATSPTQRAAVIESVLSIDWQSSRAKRPNGECSHAGPLVSKCKPDAQ